MKRIGPSTVPWGIPDITLNRSDSRPFAETLFQRVSADSLLSDLFSYIRNTLGNSAGPNHLHNHDK